MRDAAIAERRSSSVLSNSPAPRAWLPDARRPRTAPSKAAGPRQSLLRDDDTRRDSALTAPPPSLRKTPSLPAIVVQAEHAPAPAHRLSRCSLDLDLAGRPQASTRPFAGPPAMVPAGSLDAVAAASPLLTLTRRGLPLGGHKPTRLRTHAAGDADSTLLSPTAPRPMLRHRPSSHYSARDRSASMRVLSTDEMTLSRKVRTMYEHGDENAVDWDAPDEASSGDNSSVLHGPANGGSLAADGSVDDARSFVSSQGASVIVRTGTETAGGLEDWSDLQGNDVDRYGFIVPKKVRSKDPANGDECDGPDEPGLHRVTTSLQLVAQEPRGRRIGRTMSRAPSTRSTDPRPESPQRRPSWKSTRPSRSIFSNHTSHTRTTPKPLRHATNILPHNRERRMLDEASDMLKLPPGLAEVAEKREGGRAAQAARTKEIRRDDKWRRMAKVVESGGNKGAMLFEFDVNDPKVVSRTWKGIPDRWRATAWYSFLAASAKKDPNSPSEEELIESFYELQNESSAEDVQIDVDVPRTISRHIMFRRRYRGGQRLLFRVLHAMSLYLPDTGYVQGMAALAATLLCYYEEDRAFVMLVRLWMLRGLERLYESGFAGLMDALGDFEQNWLRGGDIAQKLEDLGIHSTAWGTRWYLTLFNYSLPFPAQLRVWDIFMLLGDSSYSSTPNSKFSGDLDVLHATSAALIDAMREILLDSDFENTMKVLTSWIPIKDEELLMRVAKAEYRMRKKRANA